MTRPSLDKRIDPTEALDLFDRLKDLDKTKNILFANAIADYKVLTMEWIAEELADCRLIFMNQSSEIVGERSTEQMLETYYGAVSQDIPFESFAVPARMIRDRVEPGIEVNVTDSMRRLMSQHPYLQTTAQNLHERYSQIGAGYGELCACETYRFFDYVLERMKPALVIMWCMFTPVNTILDGMCAERGLQVVYCEFGVLPGTLCFERSGQMGKSAVSQNAKEFRDLPVSDEELSSADRVWQYLRGSRLNRNKQPKNNALQKLKMSLVPGRPVIVYFGQNDFESGLSPYNETVAQEHSPIFTSSNDAALYLAELASKNGWEFIYKPHPTIARCATDMPNNVHVVDHIDINDVVDLADVCLTILSQCGYVSTIRKKATVMLGYNQLRGSGATYEAYRREDVESTIVQALAEGFTAAQEKAFIAHIARLTKYYLFDDVAVEKPNPYANDIHKLTAFLRYAMEGKDQFTCMRNVAELPQRNGNRMTVTQSLREMAQYSAEADPRPLVLFVGHLCYDHETNYLYLLAKRMPQYRWALLTLHHRADYRRVYQPQSHLSPMYTEPWEMGLLHYFIAPELFTKVIKDTSWPAAISTEQAGLMQSIPCVSEAAENLKGRHPDLAPGFAEAFATKAWGYLGRVLDVLAPQCVLMWNEFHAFHHILNGLCHSRGIDPLFMEFGSIPGTYVIERRGQMGESWAAQEPEKFLALPVSASEEEHSLCVLEQLYENRLSRRHQPENHEQELARVQALLNPGCPVIFYAGQNDFESGFYPYTEHTRKYHSPIFTSSMEAAYYLADLAQKNGWQLIYKPHPAITQFTGTHFSHPNAILATDLDINEAIDMSDVVVTIFSQTGYVGLIRRKPVVMLGYTQLRGKGACYECFSHDEVESTLHEALATGFTAAQQKAFVRHTAQMLRYFLLDDLYTQKTVPYGCLPVCAVDYLNQMLAGHRLDMLVPYQPDLLQIAERTKRREISIGELIEVITSEKIQAVSFDVFDTLLCRPVVQPVDLFALVGKRTGYGRQFIQMRRVAEWTAGRRKGPEHDGVTLNEIYVCFADLYGLDAKTAETIKQQEIEVERQYLRPRKSAQRLYQAAKGAGKKILIVSDMYLSGETVAELLRENSYDGWDELYISCDWHQSKKSGCLYDTVLERLKTGYGIQADGLVHIGDNFETDICQAEQHGITALHFPKAMDRWNESAALSSFAKDLSKDLDNSYLIGLAAQIVFDDPYPGFDPSSLTDGKWECLGTIIYAPLLIAFTKWMLERAVAKRQDKIFFLQRDGWLPEKLYEFMAPFYPGAPAHADLQLNRSLMYPFEAAGRGSLLRANMRYEPRKSLTLEAFLEKRLFITDRLERDEALCILARYGYSSQDPARNAIYNADLMLELEPFFLKNASHQRLAMEQYLRTQLSTASAPALYDTGYRGRASVFLQERLGVQCAEYHILARPELEAVSFAGCEAEAFLRVPSELIRTMPVCLVFLDDILSPQKPSIAAIESFEGDQAQWRYEDKDSSAPGIEILQKAVIEYAQTFCELFGKDLSLLCFDREQLFWMVWQFLSPAIPSLAGERDAAMLGLLRTPADASFMGKMEVRHYTKWSQKQGERIQRRRKATQPPLSPAPVSPQQPQPIKVDESNELTGKFIFIKKALRKLGVLSYCRKMYHKLFGYPWH